MVQGDIDASSRRRMSFISPLIPSLNVSSRLGVAVSVSDGDSPRCAHSRLRNRHRKKMMMVREESVLEHRSDGSAVTLVCVGVDRYAYVDRPISRSLVRLFLGHLSSFRPDSTGFEATRASISSRSPIRRSARCFSSGRVEWIGMSAEVVMSRLSPDRYGRSRVHRD